MFDKLVKFGEVAAQVTQIFLTGLIFYFLYKWDLQMFLLSMGVKALWAISCALADKYVENLREAKTK